MGRLGVHRALGILGVLGGSLPAPADGDMGMATGGALDFVHSTLGPLADKLSDLPVEYAVHDVLPQAWETGHKGGGCGRVCREVSGCQ